MRRRQFAKVRKAILASEIGRRKEAFLDKVKWALHEYIKCVTPIYLIDEVGPQQVGTGFYLKIYDKVFLISAAHVFDGVLENERYVPTEGSEGFYKVLGRFYKHRAACKRDDDINDLIAIELRETLSEYAFKINDPKFEATFQDGLYAFAGYQGTKNKVKFGTQILRRRPYYYFGKSLQSRNIASFKYSDSQNILIRYTYKKTMTNGLGPQRGARMKGISGGPVFFISGMTNLLDWSIENVRLSGVVIHTVEHHQYMAAARLMTLAEVLEGSSAIQAEFEVFSVDA